MKTTNIKWIESPWNPQNGKYTKYMECNTFSWNKCKEVKKNANKLKTFNIKNHEKV